MIILIIIILIKVLFLIYKANLVQLLTHFILNNSIKKAKDF